LYEVTGNEVSESGKLLVHATHVRALPGPDEWRIPPPSQTEPEPPPELPPGSGKDG
jgi:hypothetical protein